MNSVLYMNRFILKIDNDFKWNFSIFSSGLIMNNACTSLEGNFTSISNHTKRNFILKFTKFYIRSKVSVYLVHMHLRLK